MLNQVHIDRRALWGFMIIVSFMNVSVFCISWKAIMAGKNDFPIFYSNAQMVREGQASRLYDFDAENSFIRRISDVTRAPNNHLPYELLIFIPLTYLGFGVAYSLWTVIGLAMLAGVAMLMASPRSGRSRFWLTLLTILAFFPVWFCLLQGQDSILLTFLFTLSFWLWRRGQDDSAGFTLAMSLFRPQLVLPFVLISFVSGKWRFVRGFIPGAILVALLSTWVVGSRGMGDYVHVLIAQGTQGSATTLAEQWQVHPGLMPTLRGLQWMALPALGAGNIRNSLLLFATLSLLLWAAKRMRSAGDEAAFDLAFGVGVAVIVLVSFHSFLHDFSLMVLPLLIAGGAVASSVRVAERSAYRIITIGFLFFFTPLYIVLLFTDKVGLLVLPTVMLLWLMASWQRGTELRAVEGQCREPVSILMV